MGLLSQWICRSEFEEMTELRDLTRFAMASHASRALNHPVFFENQDEMDTRPNGMHHAVSRGLMACDEKCFRGNFADTKRDLRVDFAWTINID